MDELKQKNKTTWVNVGNHLVIVDGPMEDCEWYGSKRIVKETHIGDNTTLLMLA